MKSKKTLVILLVLLIVIVGGSVVAYNILSAKTSPDTEVTVNEDETQGVRAEKAKDFTVYDADNNPVALSEMTGKPVVVNVWATWCPPCREELSHFDTLCSEIGGEVSFMMVNVGESSGDTPDDVKAFVKENGYSFPLYFDTDSSVSAAYGIDAIPVTLFIDSNGNLVDKAVGSMDEQTLREYISKIR